MDIVQIFTHYCTSRNFWGRKYTIQWLHSGIQYIKFYIHNIANLKLEDPLSQCVLTFLPLVVLIQENAPFSTGLEKVRSEEVM